MQTVSQYCKIGLCLALSGLLSASLMSRSSAQSVLIGGSGDLASGNSYPLTIFPNGRYQQAYDGTLFSGLISIDTISFFNNNYQPGTAVIDTANYSIHLSTTAKLINGLDVGNMNANIGGDEAVFYNGVLGGAVGPTNVFSISGSLFSYNPSLGNLLIDIVKTGSLGDGSGYLDARNGTFGTDSSRIFNSSGNDSFGLVTQFSTSVSSVPEPGSVALLSGLGVTSIFAFRSIRRRR